jgi:hypothetical protein
VASATARGAGRRVRRDLRDNNGEFAHAFGTDEVPESFLINRSGRIVAIERNELQSAFLAKAIKLAEST